MAAPKFLKVTSGTPTEAALTEQDLKDTFSAANMRAYVESAAASVVDISTNTTLTKASHQGKILNCTAAVSLTVNSSTDFDAFGSCFVYADGGIVTFVDTATVRKFSNRALTMSQYGWAQLTRYDTTDEYVLTGEMDGVPLLIPQNSQSADYTMVLADAGKHIYHPSADTTARTWTIPANSSVAYSIGTAITFVNDASAGVITIAITTDTLVQAGTGSTGSRSLAANGIATALKITSTRWQISGTGLT